MDSGLKSTHIGVQPLPFFSFNLFYERAMSLDIMNKTRRQTPRLPFEKIKDSVLSKQYDLSLVFCGKTLSRKLNKKWRGKDKVANVLSFPLGERAGEIFVDLGEAKREAALMGISLTDRTLVLFIHGLYHLAGYAHGSTMEGREELTLRKFSI